MVGLKKQTTPLGSIDKRVVASFFIKLMVTENICWEQIRLKRRARRPSGNRMTNILRVAVCRINAFRLADLRIVSMLWLQILIFILNSFSQTRARYASQITALSFFLSLSSLFPLPRILLSLSSIIFFLLSYLCHYVFPFLFRTLSFAHFRSLSLSLSLFLCHTHTHTHTHSLSLFHTHTSFVFLFTSNFIHFVSPVFFLASSKTALRLTYIIPMDVNDF